MRTSKNIHFYRGYVALAINQRINLKAHFLRTELFGLNNGWEFLIKQTSEQSHNLAVLTGRPPQPGLGWCVRSDNPKKDTLHEFKELLRMNDLKGDPWGIAMGAWFDCASHLYEKGNCPFEWGFKVGWAGNVIDKDSAFFDMFDRMDAEQLEEIGQLLWRYTALLKRHGRDY